MVAVRIAAAVALLCGVVVVAGNVFDGVDWTLLLPVVAATVATLWVPRLPARVPFTVRALIVAVVVVAAAVVVAVAAGGTVGDVVPGVIDGPRRLLTTEWPSPADPTALAAVALLLGAATALAVDLARRPRWHLAPLAPIVVTLVILLALSAPRRPSWWLLGALAGLTVLFVLARPGGRLAARVATLRGERAVLVTLVVVGVAALAVATATAWSTRADPRRVAEADRTSTLMRSLEATVALREARPEATQFVVTDESPLIGGRVPTRWRVAALNEYDGQRWLPTVQVRPIGNQLAVDAEPGPDRPVIGRYRLEFRAAHTELVPLPGPPIELTGNPAPAVETDVDRVVLVLSEPAEPGTVLELTAELAPTVGEVAPAAIVAHPADEVEATFTDLAEEIAGEGDALTRLQRIEQELRSWQLDPDAPGSGQQLHLMELFLSDGHRGTAEQFASGFVLLARSLGFDARVATGFVVPPEDVASPLVVSSAHAAAWPEVNVADAGWLAFDPVPERESTNSEVAEPEPETQTPAAAQPPVDPPARTDDDDTSDIDDTDATTTGWGALATWAGRVVAGVSLITLPAALALATIFVAKLVKRRRRERVGDPSDRVRGAWANATDALVDAGLTIEPSWTDDRIAAMGAPLAGRAPHELRRLATMSTAATFGPSASDDDVTAATATERKVRAAMAAELTQWQRLRWRLSLRSLRAATRSPVEV